ncbi:Os03g0180500, partial [Oryza sativa Japonica Group]
IILPDSFSHPQILPWFAALAGAAAFLRSEGNHGAGFAALAGAARFLSSERRTSAATDLAGAGCFLTEPSGKRHNRPPPSSSEAGHRCLQAEPTACAASSQSWSALPLLGEAQASAVAAVFSSRQFSMRGLHAGPMISSAAPDEFS